MSAKAAGKKKSRSKATRRSRSTSKSSSRTTADPAASSTPNSLTFKPQPGPQTAFLTTSADIAFYGGAAGGGKSFGLLLEGTRNINVEGFHGVIFRRTSPELTNPGGLWDESKKIYLRMGAVPNQAMLTYTFDGVADIKLGHMQYDKDLDSWYGSQVPYIAFDELTTFTRIQFMYMFARNRSTCGVAPYMRATCNPDPDSWVLEIIDWWIDKEGYPIKERSGVLKWFIVESDTWVWVSSKEELLKSHPGCLPLSFTFIHADLSDNKILEEADPTYRAKLKALPAARRAALLESNWRTKKAGKLFKREWFTRNRVQPEDAPAMIRAVTAVDPSGGHGAGNDEQGIIGAGMGPNDIFYVIVDNSCKLSPAGWGAMAVKTNRGIMGDAIVAEANYGGEMVESNILAADRYAKVIMVHASRGKHVRAEPIAALCEKGRIKFIGVFPELEDECVGFDPDENIPSPNRMDAFVWAITELTGGQEPAILSWIKGQVEAEAHEDNSEFNKRKR